MRERGDFLAQVSETVVFWIRRDSVCSRCKAELQSGSFLTLQNDQPLCMECAGLDNLVFLPSGEATLTRRTRKLSKHNIVVVRFNRTRKHYEREGILVEEEAADEARKQCRREEDKLAERLSSNPEDQKWIEKMTRKLRSLYPSAPDTEPVKIACHLASQHKRSLSPFDLKVAVMNYIRHRFVAYEKLSRNQSEADTGQPDEIAAISQSWQTPSKSMPRIGASREP